MKAAFLLPLVLTASMAAAQTTTPGPADNSRANQASVNSSNKSSIADGQSNAESDVVITQRIRKALMADKHLSTYAHNVKIVTVNGEVTLNGAVRSAREKSRVEKKARQLAGAGGVVSDLKVAPKS